MATKPEPRIRLGSSVPESTAKLVTDSLIAQNRNWASPYFLRLDRSYEVIAPHPFKTIAPVQQLSEDEQDDGKLESSLICRFLDRAKLDFEDGDFIKLSDVAPVSVPNNARLVVPPPLGYLGVKVLQLSLAPVRVHGTSITLADYRVCLFLWDRAAKCARSEMICFAVRNEHGEMGDEMFFEVCDTTEDVVLVVVLMHSQAKHLDKFLDTITTTGTPADDLKKDAIPFAFSYMRPFVNGEVDPLLRFPCFVWEQSESFEAIYGEEKDPRVVALIGKVSTRIMEMKDIPKYSLYSDENPVGPVLGLSLPQRSYCPRAVMFLSGISFSFNDRPKGDFAYFVVYMCEDVSDIAKPTGMPVFVQRGHEKAQQLYRSSWIPVGKRVVFPDIVKIQFEQPIRATTTNFVVHFYTVSKDKDVTSLYKVTAFSMCTEKAAVQSGTYTFYTHKPKNVKGSDCLTKVKKVRKSSVTLSLEIPSAFFPPPVLQDLVLAANSDQANWDELKRDLTASEAELHIIPIVYKWMILLDQRCVGFWGELMMLIEKGNAKAELRSWIYNNFNVLSLNRSDYLAYLCDCFCNLIEKSKEDEQTLRCFASGFDILSDILLVCFIRGSQKTLPKSMVILLCHVVSIVMFFLGSDNSKVVEEMNRCFGVLMFYLHSVCDSPEIMEIMKTHLRSLIQVPSSHFGNAMDAFWAFLAPFSDTSEFAIFLASQIPVRQLNTIMFSPYHPVISVILFAFDKTLTMKRESATSAACDFVSRMCIWLEDEPGQMPYRAAYAFFPFIDLIARDYGTVVDGIQVIPQRNQRDLLSIILFLLGYAPNQLLKNYFVSLSAPFQIQFMLFIERAIRVCLNDNMCQGTLVKAFNQLAERVIHFLLFNIESLGNCTEAVVAVTSSLSVDFHPLPRTYLHLFDVISRIIKLYPCQRGLVTNLLSLVRSPHHLVRCYATSLILLFFKGDFDVRKTVVVSSVDFLDALTNLMLQARKLSIINMYQLMLTRIEELSQTFGDTVFVEKLKERITTAKRVSDLVKELKLESGCENDRGHYEYYLTIADQYKTFPSMRVKWLREIVHIHCEDHHYASAFVAQLHICALIATVIQHEQRMSSPESPDASTCTKPFNLIVTQPIEASNTVTFCPCDFGFFPSVLCETDIDFSSVSEDFQFLASDFTLDYFREALQEAIKLGIEAKMFYSLRPLYSLQLRILNPSRQFKDMGSVFSQLGDLFFNIKAMDVESHNSYLSFYLVKNKVYTVDHDRESQFISSMSMHSPVKLKQFEGECTGQEHPHCWNTFRVNPTLQQLDVQDCHTKSIKLVQYKTKTELPNLFICSDVCDEQTVCVSLCEQVNWETGRLNFLMSQVSREMERLFIYSPNLENESDYRQALESGCCRMEALFNALLTNEDSLTEKLNILKKKGGAKEVIDMLITIRPTIARLIRLARRASNGVNRAEFLERFGAIRDGLSNFQKHWRMGEFDTKPFKTKDDPVSEKFDFE